MTKPPQFLTDDKGQRMAVVISIEDYEKIVEELEDLEDIRAYEEAKASGSNPVPFDEAVTRLNRDRK